MAALLSWDRGNAASLFERIQNEDISLSARYHLRDLVLSIRHNLQNILNTHPGACQSASALGIVDLNDATIGTMDMVGKIQSVIEDCILDFEPRIISVDVQPLVNEDNPLLLHFRIDAILSVEDVNSPVVFSLHLDNDRHYYLDLADL
ncbi:type VI secretion system baseplate subunit TssE [Aggregatibacter actinomycetemcomitans]|uniref:type VI secretion system baseplate subunit TssE n=1 Tax=Aggregatibacter actinomycetemcomitans TaxID=714 RepID=UPI00197BD2EE|nr:type VI secretion system baseplate subunit TssE [Aggregatibacter actinomycetemcomitans]MBN6065346.1 type VI secretion system baseplate subunit TssE [Aggregatibacter actinomycetemcomitans]MBN6073732.1 type VI secretion system baseplate subunit TssE [Aggregatibacter actinomycetemcomitans]MBN6078179.1 type VI secretion system baseplate subunit TssE [Aggregatibacter actinomycetemcomitans]